MAVQIRILGDVALTGPDAAPVAVTSRRGWGLVAYLVLSGGRPVRRETLSALLWPHSGEGQARASLRQELAVTRKALRTAGLDVIASDKETVTYTGAPGCADATAFQAHLSGGSLDDLRAAAALYGGPLLDGVRLRAPEFNAWCDGARARLQSLAAGALEDLLRAEEGAGDAAAAVAAARALLAADPARERAHRTLMRARAGSGRRAGSGCRRELVRRELLRERVLREQRLRRRRLELRRRRRAASGHAAAAAAARRVGLFRRVELGRGVGCGER